MLRRVYLYFFLAPFSYFSAIENFPVSEQSGTTSPWLNWFFKDNVCVLESYYGGLSRLSNMFKGYGWYSGHKFYDHIGSLLANKCGDPDITFSEVIHSSSLPKPTKTDNKLH